MENPNIITDHKPFMVGNYNVNIRYRRRPNLSDTRYLDTINGYQRYTTKNPLYFYFIKDEFYGLGSEKIVI